MDDGDETLWIGFEGVHLLIFLLVQYKAHYIFPNKGILHHYHYENLISLDDTSTESFILYL